MGVAPQVSPRAPQPPRQMAHTQADPTLSTCTLGATPPAGETQAQAKTTRLKGWSPEVQPTDLEEGRWTHTRCLVERCSPATVRT